MTIDELVKARESYSYIPARLVLAPITDQAAVRLDKVGLKMDVPPGWEKNDRTIWAQYSSIGLDTFHRELLNSQEDGALLHGLLSVTFWGYLSGARGRVTEGRALARTNWICQGRGDAPPQNKQEILLHLRTARQHVLSDSPALALREAMRISYLGMSFASKVVAFMGPDVASVYDKIISDGLREETNPELQALFVDTAATVSESKRATQVATYGRWCNWCVARASELNLAGRTWNDWNGTVNRWRAIDIERALFSTYAQRRSVERYKHRRQ